MNVLNKRGVFVSSTVTFVHVHDYVYLVEWEVLPALLGFEER